MVLLSCSFIPLLRLLQLPVYVHLFWPNLVDLSSARNNHVEMQLIIFHFFTYILFIFHGEFGWLYTFQILSKILISFRSHFGHFFQSSRRFTELISLPNESNHTYFWSYFDTFFNAGLRLGWWLGRDKKRLDVERMSEWVNDLQFATHIVDLYL